MAYALKAPIEVSLFKTPEAQRIIKALGSITIPQLAAKEKHQLPGVPIDYDAAMSYDWSGYNEIKAFIKKHSR